MRSSKNIAAATSTASVNQAQVADFYKIQQSIPPGFSSTVPGARPRAMLFKRTPDVDHSKLARFVKQLLSSVDTEHIKCVVLTDDEISPRHLSVDLIQNGITRVSYYDGGVERFDWSGKPKYIEGEAGDGGEAELTEWLRAEAGVLVTSKLQFRGCEADTVIFVTRAWSGYNIRSPVTRAVARLMLVTSDWALSVHALRRDWDVEIVEESDSETWESDSETGDSDE